MNQMLNFAIVTVIALTLGLATYFAYLGHIVEAKEVAMMVVSALAGAIGGHATAKSAETTTGDINVTDKGQG